MTRKIVYFYNDFNFFIKISKNSNSLNHKLKVFLDILVIYASNAIIF